MATRDIYETTFDEDVQAGSSANQCPECNGRVTTNAVETVCEGVGSSSTSNGSTTGLNGERSTRTNVNGRVHH